MRLLEEHREAWLADVSPEFGDAEWRALRFVTVDQGRIRARVRLNPLDEDTIALGGPLRTDGGPIGPDDAALVLEAIEGARALGWRHALARPLLEALTPALVDAFERSGG